MKQRPFLVHLTVGLLMAVLMLSGCASIPKSSAIRQIESNTDSELQEPYRFDGVGPVENAEPRQIVEGFIEAGASIKEDYRIAREFMTKDLSDKWKGNSRVLIYEASEVLAGAVTDSYTIQLEVTGEVDAKGVRTLYPPHSTRAVDVELTKVEGQWRISRAPDGIMLEASTFPRIFSPRSIYFYDSSYKYLVPDVRWFAAGTGTATSMVEAMLDGPAPYLENAVTSAFSQASQLVRSAVPVSDGVATVDLNKETFAEATDLSRQLMQQQLEVTLDSVAAVNQVTMKENDTEVNLGDPAPNFEAAQINPSVPDTQIAVADQSLAFVKGRSVIPVGGMPDLSPYAPRDPAMSPVGNRYTFLNGKRTQLWSVSDVGELRLAATGGALVRPSMDAFGWTWTADNTEKQPLVVVPEDIETMGEYRPLSVPWLDDSKIESLRISRDGARALIVLSKGRSTHVYIAGVIRDADGVPRGLSENPMEVFAQVPVNTAVWSSDTSIIVAEVSGDQSVQAEEITLQNGSELFSYLLGMKGISAGPGDRRPVYAETADKLLTRVGNSWHELDDYAKDISYPG
ncbi:LpqB family beta-propeller domain-containing protein [Glutamicibacter sp. PS]|uniref:LpqB family beta-propeller domain-containing protein n=1 Tax=Glutamicibacter sp. PS TaxID=3075634 RepID=UPI0028411EC4|nr:LpqB family beta-propeller domain-containing protein [Glutamicibacter sp. PS]MDR4532386.1 LpqB family beta-propeller domain-containing protein [Glutamicibacter sp. PS]